MSITETLLVVDCDPGVDDALALLMAFVSSKVKIIAITTVFGTASQENTTRNALYLLNFANKKELPLYAGAKTSINGKPELSQYYFGKDGFGDVIVTDPQTIGKARDTFAPNALVEIVKLYPDQIELVTLGPLTNIAQAMKIDPDFGKKLKKCWIMGGTVGTDKKNKPIKTASDFNFRSDPEAASSVLASLGAPITLIPSQDGKPKELPDDAFELKTKNAEFIKKIFAKTAANNTSSDKRNMADSLLMAVVIDTTIATVQKKAFATVDDSSKPDPGKIVVDWEGKLGKTPNVNVVLDCDLKKYQKMINKALTG